MSKARGGNLFYRLVWSIGNNPLRILEVLQFFLLAWVLLQLLAGFGGVLAYGLPMVAASKSLILLAVVHLVVMLLRPTTPAFHWILVVPLPFIGYLALHWMGLSPFTWNAAPITLLNLQAYAVFLITFNSVYSKRTAIWMVAVLQVPALLAVSVAFLRYYVFPEWIPDRSRLSDPAYAHGAGGFLQDPANLAILILLLLPLLLTFIIKYRSNGPVRLFSIAMIALLSMGLVVSSNAFGLILFPVILSVAPFFLSDKWRVRKAFWKWCAFLVPLALFTLYISMGVAFERLLNTLLVYHDPAGEASRTTAVMAFREHPLTGIGLGGFAESWDRFSPPTGLASRHAVGSYHELLAETGLAGLFIWGVSVLVFLVWSFRIWSAIPFSRVDADVAHRLKSFPEDHPLHRRLSREKGRMSTRKAVIGGLWLGILAGLVYAVRDYSLTLPLVIFYFALCTALLTALCRGYENQNRGKIRTLFATAPLVLATVAGAVAIRYHYANHTVFTATERLALLQADPEQVFHSQVELNAVITELQLAIDLVPTHGEAVTRLGTAELLTLFAELDPPETVAMRAMPVIEQALALNPFSWESHFNAAVANLLAGRREAAMEHLDRSLGLAPGRVEPRALKGSLMLLADPDSTEAREMLQSVLSQNPDLSVVRSLLRTSGMQGNPAAQRLVTISSLARQFHVLPPGKNRVNGAGLLRN